MKILDLNLYAQLSSLVAQWYKKKISSSHKSLFSPQIKLFLSIIASEIVVS